MLTTCPYNCLQPPSLLLRSWSPSQTLTHHHLLVHTQSKFFPLLAYPNLTVCLKKNQTRNTIVSKMPSLVSHHEESRLPLQTMTGCTQYPGCHLKKHVSLRSVLVWFKSQPEFSCKTLPS